VRRRRRRHPLRGVPDPLRQRREVAEHADADASLRHRGVRRQIVEASLRERKQRVELVSRPREVLARERVDAQDAHAEEVAPAHDVHELVRARAVPDARWERPRRGEASVTVHHDRDVFWDRAARAQRGGDEIARHLAELPPRREHRVGEGGEERRGEERHGRGRTARDRSYVPSRPVASRRVLPTASARAVRSGAKKAPPPLPSFVHHQVCSRAVCWSTMVSASIMKALSAAESDRSTQTEYPSLVIITPTRRRAPARRRAHIVLSIMPAPPPVAASSSSLLLSRVLALDPIALLACALFLMGVYFALVLAAGSSPLARIVLFKTSLFARSVRHLALSREKSGWPKTRPDPDVVVADVALSPPREKRVIFVRHGESTWNEVFNRGFGPGFPLRLAWGLLHEAAVIFSRGSFFVDAPLSHRGYRQARELRAFLKTYEPTGDGTTTNPDAAALRGDVRRVLIHTGPRTTASAW